MMFLLFEKSKFQCASLLLQGLCVFSVDGVPAADGVLIDAVVPAVLGVLAVVGAHFVVGFPAFAASLTAAVSLLLLPCLPVCDVSPLATIVLLLLASLLLLTALLLFFGWVPANVVIVLLLVSLSC
jgi:hypothetical protein